VTGGGEVSSAAMDVVAPARLTTKNRTVKSDLAWFIALPPVTWKISYDVERFWRVVDQS
jgi:hypothetical protein